MFNPYQPPSLEDNDGQRSSKPFLTRRRVFWCGLGGIASALLLITGSQTQFVASRRTNQSLDTLVIFIDCIAGLLFFGGIIALIVYHWFPDPTRKFPWQRKRKNPPGPND